MSKALAVVMRAIGNYKKIKALVDDWKKTAAEMVKLKMDVAKQSKSK